jgi:hypothetical protein
MSAPKHTVTQTQETTSWSVSLSPAALLGAYLAPGLPTALGCLPNVAVQQSDGTSSSTTHAPTILRADDLSIHCDNAVFSGSKIHARLMEAIVDGSLTIETLTDEFRSDSHSTAIGGSLAAISGMLRDVKVDPLYAPQTSSVPGSDGFIHPAFSAVPTLRIADEEAMSQKIREVARMVGTERFYLTVGGLLHKKGAMVGLKPDGVVVRSNAERINAGRILEEKVREAESHKRTVINPAIGEFVAMMSQIDELQQVRAKIALLKEINGASQNEAVEQSDKEIKELLKKPELKGKLQKLILAQQQADEKVRQPEAKDPTLPSKAAEISAKKETTDASLDDILNCRRAEEEKRVAAKEMCDTLTSPLKKDSSLSVALWDIYNVKYEKEEATKKARAEAGNNAIKNRNLYLESQLDDPTISVELSSKEKLEAYQRGTNKFDENLQHQRKIEECKYKALKRFAKKEGYVDPPKEVFNSYPTSVTGTPKLDPASKPSNSEEFLGAYGWQVA